MSGKRSIVKNIIQAKIKKVVIVILSIFIITCALAKPSFADTAEYKFNMSYIYFGEPSQYAARIQDTKGSISEISPSYFDLNADGSLKITSKIDRSFISEMHKKGIRVVPFLSNHWDRYLGRTALSNRYRLVDQIIDAIIEYNLDGVNIDLENLNEEDRNAYTDFVRLLRSKIPEGKVLAVAVASNPNGLTVGWHGSYDYSGLGKYSDYLMIMTYDEHYSGGSAGPVASIGFVENSIKYALERVPKDKIVLGIPFFGRIWKNGGGISGQGANMNTIETLISRYRGQVTFDNASLSPKAVITINVDDVKPYIFDRRLDAGTYTIWYENEASIKYKLELVKKYDLKGTGSWSLGQETLNTWDYYDLWLNGHYYTDSQGHWALRPIIFAANKRWMIGNGSTSFAPNKTITRAEAAAAVVHALGLRKEETQSENGDVVTFSDISQHWAKEEIEIAAQHKIVQGRGDETFGPNEAMTREEIAVLADRVFSNQNILASQSTQFVSFNTSDSNTITSNTNATSNNATSNNATTTNNNIISSIAAVGSIINTSVNIAYKDVNREICTWSYDSIISMTQRGILTGSPDGRFLPKERTSRAEMATLLYRMFSR